MTQLDQKIVELFKELLELGEQLLLTRTSGGGELARHFGRRAISNPTYEKVSPESATEWGMRCLNVLKRVFGADSDYFQAFKEQSSGFTSFSNYEYVTQALSILKAAKTDYVDGYLFDTRVLIQAEVFDGFLEQAAHLLESGYYGPAAVVAGCVLEDGLRKLSLQNDIVVTARGTIEPLNVELARAGAYGLVVKQRITALAAIRNKAAHGRWTEFDQEDVKHMIDGVGLFMQNCFG